MGNHLEFRLSLRTSGISAADREVWDFRDHSFRGFCRCSRVGCRFDIIATTPQIPEACSRSQSGVSTAFLLADGKRFPLRLYHLTVHPNSWPKQCCVMQHAFMAHATSFCGISTKQSLPALRTGQATSGATH